MFSHRLPRELTPNRLARAVEQVRLAGDAIIDLTASNPTRAELVYPADLLAPLGDPRGLTYSPEPLGLMSARRAIASDYERRGARVAADRIVLTASTSDAYSLLFKVLCDAGDEVLAPRPSYPLFDHLTRMEAVTPVQYDLEYHGSWSIDLTSVERVWSPRVRAVLVVSPNNPTGSLLKPGELETLAAMCAARQAAIIVDEVFADYDLRTQSAAPGLDVLGTREALVFSLGGLSKTIGLPQAKLAWLACGGPHALVSAAIERLEIAADTYLSVSTPVQLAAATLLARGAPIREQIQRRIVSNYAWLSASASGASVCRVLTADGGWHAVLRVPSLEEEEELVMKLLTERGVLVHPGYFFDFRTESFVIVSLLVPESAFRDGIARVLGHFDCGT